MDNEEIEATLRYAEENRENRALIRRILEKAGEAKGLPHREAAVLLACADEELNREILALARRLKEAFYGSRVVMFAPLYLSNYCVNGCAYCPYHVGNKRIPRKKLTQEEIAAEAEALQDMGHKRLALEAGEDPVNNPIDYILDSIRTIYSARHKNGAIRRANVNIAATTEENYAKLRNAGIGTYILFQETYNRENYEKLHLSGPKSGYAWHTEAMDRAMRAGVDDVGLGALFGLSGYKYEFAGLLMHTEHLEAVFGVGAHTISVPRVRPADDVDSNRFQGGLSDEAFAKLVACIRVAAPYAGIIISTRENEETRARLLSVGVSQISGGSRTGVGSYAGGAGSKNTEQFEISDDRSLEEVVAWLIDSGHIPSFCTACYREGRTGDRFMSLCKSGQIHNCCTPNALLTLREYLLDYAGPSVRAAGEALIESEAGKVPNLKAREVLSKRLKEVSAGARDLRF
jgi:2-iminoacetate synthase